MGSLRGGGLGGFSFIFIYDVFSEYKYLIVNLIFPTSVFGVRISFWLRIFLIIAYVYLFKHNIKVSYHLYLEGLLGITDEDSVCNTKKLFSILKSSKQDQTDSPPLQKGNRLMTDTTEKKADLHNQQF